MEQICINIKYAFNYQIDNITDGIVTFKSGQSWSNFEPDENSTFSQNAKDSVGGVLVEQSLTPQKRNSTAAFVNDCKDRRFILQIQMENETAKTWGSLDNPVVCIPSTEGKISSFKFLRTALEFI
jgi:hypothetical protein